MPEQVDLGFTIARAAAGPLARRKPSRGRAARPRKAEAVHLVPALTAAEAFARIARACVTHMVANVDCAAAARDPEGVHQLRVGIRRLRAAFSAFRDVLPAGPAARLGRDLRWLQGALGVAREWDVFIGDVLTPVRAAPAAHRGLKPLLAASQRERSAAYAACRAALASRRCQTLLRDLARATAPNDGGVVPPAARRRAPPEGSGQPVATLAATALRKRHKQVHKLGRKLGKLRAEELHALRIRVKRLRYAIEFFADLWPGKATKRYVAVLKRLQDITGQAEDAIVALEQLERLGAATGHDTARLIADLRKATTKRLGRLRRRLVDPWKRFQALEAFWSAAP